MAQQVTVPSQHPCRLPQEAAEQARVSWSGEQAGHPSCRFPGGGRVAQTQLDPTFTRLQKSTQPAGCP